MDMHQQCEPHGTTSFIATPNAEHFASDDTNEAEDEIANLLSLKLKKPKHWNWELSTSRACSNIALPRILLYDHKGNLLIDVNSQEEQVFKEPNILAARRSQSSARVGNQKRLSRSSTVNLSHSIRQQLNKEFNGLQIDEANTPSSQLSPINSSTLNSIKSPSLDTTTASSCIDFFTNDLSDYKIDRRSSSLRSVRFKDDDRSKASTVTLPLNDIQTPPQSSVTTPTTSSSGGRREKRRYRRSRSSGRSSSINSPSILERFSFNKGRFSSPEYAEEHEVFKPPRYVLRTSKAGTLLVQEDSFNRCRRRRLRPKNSFSENSQNEILPRRRRSNSFLQIPENIPPKQLQPDDMDDSSIAASADNLSGKKNKRKMYTRRHRTDIDLCTPSSSEEEFEDAGSRLDILNRLSGTQQNYGNLKKRLKGAVPLHPGNDVFHPYGSPTER